jgi:LysR family transcriptional regulator, regulator for metE and metH
VAAVLAGEIDAAIAPNVAPDERLSIQKAFEEEIVVVMRPDDVLAKRARISVADLAGRTVYAHETPAEQVSWFRRALGRTAPPLLRVMVRVPLTEAIVDLVRSGAGVAILGAWTVTRDLARGELCTRPLSPGVRRTLSVVTARNARHDARVQLLASVLANMPSESPPSPLKQPGKKRAQPSRAADLPKKRARNGKATPTRL